MKFSLFWLAPLALACATANISSQRHADVEFGRFVDEVVKREMEREHIPGAAFVFVRDGRVVYSRGYGVADIGTNRSVDENTIWRIGSISKTFTSVAVVQLAQQGSIHLQGDANTYLRRFQIPATYPLPVTVTSLLTHTSGFDELRPGTQAPSAAEVLPLDKFLSGRLVRIRPPGETTAYSTYGMTVAGALVEDVSKQAFEEYLRQHVWSPLAMRRTSITIPTGESNIAIGYERNNDGKLEPQAWEWYHTTPASSINSTAADMARYMIALLGQSPILSESARFDLLRQHVSMHPRIPGVTLGLWEDFVGNLRVVEHGGNVAGFSAQMTLIPSHNTAFFIVNQFEGSRLRDNVKEQLLTHLYPEARERRKVPAPSADFAQRAAKFAGRYVPMFGCVTCEPPRAPFILRVEAEGDALRMSGKRWIECDPLLFVREDGTGYIAFRTGTDGRITEMFVGGFWTFRKVD